MAQFNADIQLKVLVDGLNQAVNKVNKAVQKIQDKGLKLDAKINPSFARELDRAAKSVQRLGTALKAVGAVGGGAGLVSLVNALGNLRGVNLGAIEQAAGALAKLTDPILTAAAGAPGLTAGLVAGGAAAAAFSPQIVDVVKQLGKIGPVVGKLTPAVQQAFSTVALMAFGSELKEQVNDWNGYVKAVQVASDKISQLKKAQDALQASLNNKATSDSKALNTARKLAEVQERLNNALRAQRDLIREAKGVNVEELEAAKGRKSIETRQKREQYLAKQAAEQMQVTRALQEMEERTITLLEQQLSVERRITNARSQRVKEAAKESIAGFKPQFAPGSDDAALVKKRIAAREAERKVINSLGQLETSWTKKINSLKTKNAAARYRLEQRRIKKLADQEAAAAKDRSKRLESLALGVGFPLLFGGGVGSVGGSALGSFAGDGFGGQIIGGAIGQTLDNFVQGIGELGQALNPVTADVGRIVESAGLAGTELGKAITELENTAGSAAALREATKELERVVGEDGVEALRKFGDRFTAFGSQLAEFFTKVQVAIAKLLQESPTEENLRKTGETIFQARRSDNTEIQDAVSRLDNASTPNERLAIQKEIVRLVNEEADARQRVIEEAAKLADIDQGKLNNAYAEQRVVQAELELLKLEGDLTSDVVYEQEKKVALLQYYAAIQDIVDSKLSEELKKQKMITAEIEYRKALEGIEIKRKKAFEGGGTGGRSGGGVDKEAQAQKAIASELTKQFELKTKLATIDTSKLEKIDIELGRLEAKRALKQAELELSTEDSRVLAAKLETLNLETKVLREQLELQRERAQLEEKITSIKGEQGLTNLQRGLDQELAGLTLPSGDAFGDEQAQLALKQQQRYANVLADVNDKLAIQREYAKSSDEGIAGAAKKRIEFLEREKGIYETMLPAIAEAEQQQLKFNQTLSLVEGPVNAFVNGLTEGLQGLIEGTMTAEEAFSKMLKGMAQALMQTAAQMIAQYIAIGIAKAFAGMGGNTAQEGAFNIGLAAGGRASGGVVNGNTPYIVGENGPELFVPGKSGTVVNNDDFADAAAAMGASSSSFEESGEALEMATAARGGNTSAALAGAIQAFADSGSAMATASSNRASNSAAAAQASALQTAESYFSAGKSTVSFDTYRVGEMDVVTREDAMRIGMESAKQAEANVYKGLKNMPAIRGRSGVK